MGSRQLGGLEVGKQTNFDLIVHMFNKILTKKRNIGV